MSELERRILDLDVGSHACLLYESHNDQLAAVIPFIRAGLERGHRCLYIVDDLTAADVVMAVSGGEHDVAQAVRSGRLIFHTKRETYLRNDHFEPDGMLAFLGNSIDESEDLGFSLSNITGEMTWALGPEPGNDRLIEYEARLNDLLRDRSAVVICQYNRSRFPPEVIRDILRTHPVAIVGEHVYPNLFYERPEAVLNGTSAADRVDWMLQQLDRVHQASEDLRVSQTQLETLLRNVPAVIARVGPDLRYIYVNPAVEEVLGIPVASIMGRTAEESGLPEAVIGVSGPVLRRVFASGDAEEMEFEVAGQDGPLWLRCRYVAERDVLHTIESVLVLISDITEQKTADQRIRSSEAHFRALIDQSSDMILVVDASGTIRFQSQAGENMLGYRAEESVGTSAFDLLHPDDLPAAQAAFASALAEQDTPASFAYRARHRDGGWRHLEAVGRNLLDDPDLGAFVVNVRDVTERVQMEARLRQAEKLEAVGRLAGGVAHDFNNLITSIRGYAVMVHEEMDPATPARADVAEIIRGAERAAALTSQLLAFGRKQRHHRRLVCMNDVVQDLEPMLRRLIAASIQFDLDLGTGLPRIDVDPTQMEQVLVNLVLNAADAVAGQGRISVTTRAITGPDGGGSAVLLAVSDDGPGIPDDVRDHLFEPFFTTKEMGKGTGLGLPTVYGIVEQSGGVVRLCSEPGEGATFEIVLPAAADSLAESVSDTVHPAVPVAAPGSAQPAGGTVLLVEDEDGVRTFASRVLSRKGYATLAAAGPEDALRIASEHPGPIDLLVTDVVMPQQRGPDLARAMQRLRPGLRVLFISGYQAASLENQIDATLLLEKPFTAEELLERVAVVLMAGVNGSAAAP